MEHNKWAETIRSFMDINVDRKDYPLWSDTFIYDLAEFLSDRSDIAIKDDVKREIERCNFWEKRAKIAQADADYYQIELQKAHELLGRVLHQLSERWDSVRLTKYHPTDNLHGKRTLENPSGK